MAQEDMYFKGKVSWVRVVNPDNYDCWSLNLHPVSEDLERIRDLQAKGLKNMIKKDADGYYTKFRCPVSKVIRGKTVSFERPSVVDKEGKPMDGLTIGNGSDATVKVEVYEHGTPGGGKAVAARLKGLRVDNLIPFSSSDYTEAEAGNNAGLKDQPEQLF